MLRSIPVTKLQTTYPALSNEDIIMFCRQNLHLQCTTNDLTEPSTDWFISMLQSMGQIAMFVSVFVFFQFFLQVFNKKNLKIETMQKLVDKIISVSFVVDSK